MIIVEVVAKAIYPLYFYVGSFFGSDLNALKAKKLLVDS